MKIVEIAIEKIVPYEKNPRINDQAVDAVVHSIEAYGWHGALLLNTDNVIICGHTRWKAAKQLGMSKVPCIIADGLTPVQVQALRIIDNSTAEKSTWNYDLVLPQIETLRQSGMDMSFLDFEIIDLSQPIDKVKEGKTDPDAVPEEPEETKSTAGTLYRCGEHLLLCGDSCKEESVLRLMGSDRAALYLTDPPYNVAYEGKTKDALKIKNDKMSDSSFFEFLISAFKSASAGLMPGAVFYIFYTYFESVNFRNAVDSVDFLLQNTLFWVKNHITLGHFNYHYKTEPCLYGWKDGGEYHWYSDGHQSNLLRFNKPNRNGEHPTMKPIDMLLYLLKNSSKRGDLVLDSFGGSGSTMIACEQLGRRCRMIELDPHYCDVIRKRYAEFVAGEGCDWESLTPEVTDAGK